MQDSNDKSPQLSSRKTKHYAELSRGSTRDLGHIANYVARPAFDKKPPFFARILSDWDDIAGPELAQLSYPQKLHGDVLTLIAVGPAALQIQHMSEIIMERVNRAGGLVGAHKINRLKVVQGILPTRDTRMPAAGSKKRRKARGTLDQVDLEEMLNGIEDEEMRNSMRVLAESLFHVEQD